MQRARGLPPGKAATSGGAERFLPRAVVLALASLLLLTAPATAEAAFSGTDGASFTASTYSIPAPASVTATVACNPNGKQATVTVSSYAKVSRATAYLFTLAAPDGTSSQVTTASDGTVLTQSSTRAGTRVYTLTIQAEVASWTGAALTQSYTC